MSEERKPVICPRGHEMKLIVEHREYAWTCPPLPDMWFAHYYCDCGWTAPDDGTGDTKVDSIRDVCNHCGFHGNDTDMECREMGCQFIGWRGLCSDNTDAPTGAESE